VRTNQYIRCERFPCADVKHECYIIPDVDIKPEKVSIVMISEATPVNTGDYYYATGDSLFQQTTIQAFNDAGIDVSSMQDILNLGVYLTTAVKCGKTGYGIKPSTIKECSSILEREIALFPEVKAFMLMGDVSIKAINDIAKRTGEGRVIPIGSTYKIRGQKYLFRGKLAFPSYLQAGPSFFIEKSKRKMIADDIREVMRLVQ
jgi:uracil-DNA glycosylase